MHEIAIEIVDAARERGLTVRVAGAVGVKLQASNHGRQLMSSLGRYEKDLDLVAPKKDRSGLEELLAELGYEMVGGRGVTIGVWDARSIFRDTVNGRPDVDLFIDELAFCHRIDLRRRLDMHPVTISPEDLFLSKAQIVEITRNDLIDVAVLLAERDAGGETSDHLDLEYVANIVTNEWGFYRTVTANLVAVREFAADEPALRSDLEAIQSHVTMIEASLEGVPKRVRFKLRAAVGDRVRWYAEVGEGVRE